ncbi:MULTISPECIES: ABC transporter permease [Neoroseomonas]|jgi:peptide/nickel transport system permease protein|uniref:ABC transporter permease n=2 Tax=Neoroseomonas TaxID=2870716 RepID=A0A9X9WJM2_9PROT|nr:MULTISPECIES: ABC transporter permease [Neoroseomonas]MBR0660532.1 ABC transporter permease [Neoroseomonas oryzicola]NKE16774.1 ABC transporter permease [Neoroseomonas oryzicola]NMJ42840.1 ABC transporter permease [Neoroseomonas marina]
MSDVADAEGIALKREHPARATLRRLFRHRLFVTGLLLFGVIAVIAITAPWITTADPQRLSMRNKFLPPGEAWVFGTDNFGRSLWSRVVWGAQLSMIIGASVVGLNAVFGTLIGALAGYFRRLDNALMRVNDALMAFPAILLAIAVTSVLGPSTLNVILALSIVYIPRTARIVRSSVIVLREMEYVQAAVAAGAGHWRILRHHILPNAMAPMIVQLSFLFAYAVLSEATLSFLGVGAVPPTPTWGNIMAEGRDFMREAPWIITIPGVALMITVMGLNLLGDGLRDVLDPRLRIQQ